MKVQKAIEISDAKIQFVSLVDKAANLRQFLVTKGKNGKAQFSTYGKILKVDADTHYITGIVYEPLVEDAHGNYMTEDEIRKAAYYYAKNGDQVDLQHSFESADGLAVVENYVAPCDMTIGETPIIKGSWIITVECSDTEIWDSVQKGELTGFSMGGIGKYSEEDTDLENVKKSAVPAAPKPADEKVEKRGVLKKLSELLGLDPIEKGEVLDKYNESARSSAFWNAIWALEDVLYHYDYRDDRYVFTTDAETVREALEDFSRIVTDVLTLDTDAIIKAVTLPVVKAGKKMSSANKKKLDDICQALSDFKTEFENDEDDEESGTVKKEVNTDMEKKDIETLVNETVTKAIKAAGIVTKEAEPAAPAAPASPAAAPAAPASTETPSMEETVAKAVKKALEDAGLIEKEEEPTEPAPATKEDIESAVAKAVGAAIEPLLKSRGLPSNLNGEKPIEKDGQHFLHGLL